MGQRRFRAPRCPGCGLHLELCVCATMPTVELDFGVIVIQNNHERNKPTNTGRLIPMMIPQTRLLRYAVRGEVFDASVLRDPALAPILLFPRDTAAGLPAPVMTAQTLAASAELGGARRALVILDGTWGQCSRMSRRIPEVAGLPAFTLPDGAPGRWGGVREASEASRLCTFEALIRVITLGAGPEISAPLQAHFNRIVAGMLFMKAKLPSPDVPEDWV